MIGQPNERTELVDPVTLVLLIAAAAAAWWIYRTRGRRRAPDLPEAANYLTPKPLSDSFRVEGWDGFSGMQMALAVELSEGCAFPLLQAGTEPPASRTQTFSTAEVEQTHLTLRLYAGLTEEVHRLKLAQRVSIGPIPQTGEAIREVEVTLSVDESGRISVTAQYGGNGSALTCSVLESDLDIIPIGRQPRTGDRG